jgi:hypothetical protein
MCSDFHGVISVCILTYSSICIISQHNCGKIFLQVACIILTCDIFLLFELFKDNVLREMEPKVLNIGRAIYSSLVCDSGLEGQHR